LKGQILAHLGLVFGISFNDLIV